MKLFFDDEAFDGQLQRSIGKADAGMANVGECLAIAAQITAGDRDSWYNAWFHFAQRLDTQANTALAAQRAISARGAYFRATEYYRQAFFFHRDDLDSPKLRTAYAASVRAFAKFLPLASHRSTRLSGHLSGYLFSPTGATKPLPTILHINGYDGTAEELYSSAYHALDRGYAFAAVDGPGQGASLFDRCTPMRPDWEHVLPAMLDELLTLPEIDPQRVALVGRSFGGLIAVRGAACEHRIAALLLDPGQYDMGSAVIQRLGAMADRLDDATADPLFESLLQEPAMAALLGPRMVTNGTPTVRGYFNDMKRYSNIASAPLVTCPTFVTDNESDTVSTGQGKLLFDHLNCDKFFRLFSGAEGAVGHCEGMAPIAFWTAAFDWLDEVLT